MKISTATSVFVNYSFPDAVEAVVRAGFAGVDLWCGRPHLYRHDHSPAMLEEIRRKLENHQVVPVSLMPAFFRYPYSLSSPMEVVRQDSIAYVKECIDNALVIGAGQVLIVPTHSLHGQPLEDARARFMNSMKEICTYADKTGVNLGLEILYPQLSDYMCTSSDAITAIHALGYAGLGAVLDTGHINLSGEELESAMKALGSLLLQVHVNDNDGKQQQNAIPGEGSFDFSKLAQLLNRDKYQGFLTLELGWTYSFDPYPAVCLAHNRLQAFLAEAGG